MSKKILVLGGTGALGRYLVKSLIEMDYVVDVVSMDDWKSDHPNLTYIQANIKDMAFLEPLVKKGYDGIVDFMVYFSPEEFKPYCDLFLNNTDHYIFHASYRVYANSWPITEESPRLLDVSEDQAFLNSGDYAIYKAQQEDMLRASGKTNWTSLRPAITYSTNRFQLVTLEANILVWRMLRGKTVVLPEYAMDIEATMSWAGDYGRMVSRLLFNPKAYGEVFTVSTNEHHKWREIAEMYKEIGGLKYVTVDTETYLNIIGPGSIVARQQLTHDRYFNRIVDNTKIREVTGLEQDSYMKLRDGLALEYAKVTMDCIPGNEEANRRMDEYLASVGLE